MTYAQMVAKMLGVVEDACFTSPTHKWCEECGVVGNHDTEAHENALREGRNEP
jgi:hypothetical protein